jgi:hypothetical protein
MAQTEAEIRKQQAIERLIRLQAEKAVKKTMTTIVDGEIIRVPPPDPFTGGGRTVGELEDVSVNPGPGMEPLVRARKIKATIDAAVMDAMGAIKQVDPKSPFLDDLDPIITDTAKLIVSEPDKLRAGSYEVRQMARIGQVLECLATYKEIRQAADERCNGLAADAPERLRADRVCATAVSDLRAAPDSRDTSKEKAVAALAKLAAYTKTKTGIETALADVAQKIRAVDPRSAFLEDLDLIRGELKDLIIQGSEQLSAEGFEATQVQRVGPLPGAAEA